MAEHRSNNTLGRSVPIKIVTDVEDDGTSEDGSSRPVYRETSMFRHHLFPRNMTELRIWQSFGATPPPHPPPSCVGIEDIYISNSYCNAIILVYVLVVRTK